MKLTHYITITLLALTACNQPEKRTAEDKTGTTAAAATEPQEPEDKVTEIKQADEQIMAIRQQVTTINTAKLEQRHLEFQCDELMKVDRFFNNGKLAKISIDYGWIGDAHAIEDYYYDDAGNVIFFYEFVEGGATCETCTIKKNEYRSYIHDGKVIKYLKNKTPEACRKCDFGAGSKPARLFTVGSGTQEDIKRVLCR